MIFEKFKAEYKSLANDFHCGNIVIDNFLQSNDALDINQGITYILLTDEKDFIIGYYNISAGVLTEWKLQVMRYIICRWAVLLI